MSGHNKWAKVKHVKAKADAIRGKQFSRIIKEITVAAKLGGGDAATNPRLRTALLAARDVNMPKDNIERAIKRGTGELEGVNYEEVAYEGYGPSGVALIAKCLTDNTNRTVAEINKIFSKGGGNMGVPGCVSFMFDSRGYFFIPKEKNPTMTEEAMMEHLIEAGADDMITEEDGFDVYCDPKEFGNVQKYFEEQSIETEDSKLIMHPQTTTKITGDDVAKVLRLVDNLEEHDDVQDVFHNYDISDEDMEKYLETI
ncbi:MAG: YebC/PmpR family DNA-binding transcriptional regulator [Candidatus Riflebacteria bacterium]|mgnify:CR=1 FL=1|nr:YebC/PmpR family DNA-binding transcriptional regulator [Candidatus Riflebacteria bacterium]